MNSTQQLYSSTICTETPSEIIILKTLICPMVTQKHTKLGLVPALLIVKPKINTKKVELFCAGISSQQIGDQSRLGN